MDHYEVFHKFVIQHDILKHIKYGIKPKNQKRIGIRGTNEKVIPILAAALADKRVIATVIDPNFDEIVKNFINLDHNIESVNYIKDLISSIELMYNIDPLKSTKEWVDFCDIHIIKMLLDMNIQSDVIYVRISTHNDESFYHEIIEV